MASLLSFSWRKTQNKHEIPNNASSFGQLRSNSTDPWNLGVATSTSSTDDTQSSFERVRTVNLPSTPEGLRPRKSISRIRAEVQERRQASAGYPSLEEDRFTREKPSLPSHESLVHEPYMPPTSCFQSSLECGTSGLPPLFQCTRNSPLPTQPSSNSRSMEDDIYDYDDRDIISVVDSPLHNRQRRHQQVAESPDLKPGKAKTAVGALLVAMSESGEAKNQLQASTATENPALNVSQKSILPPREWMSSNHDDDDNDEDDTIREDTTQYNNDGDDNESSLHASPSSNLWRRNTFTSWKDRQAQFQQDTSFTREFLGRDLNSSVQLEQLDGNRPYDFDPILAEDANSIHEMDTPQVLALVNDCGGLNVSGISSSYHQKDIASLHSLADKMEDEEDDEPNEVPWNYEPLVEDAPEQTSGDNALVLIKAHNQRRIKEELLLSTFERLQDESFLVKEIAMSMEDKTSFGGNFFLGLDQNERDVIHKELEGLLFKLMKRADKEETDKYEAKQLSLRFCMSALQTSSGKIEANHRHQIIPQSSGIIPYHRWKALPGFRKAAGLEEDVRSPPTIRGGDTSLFSLPSDSANDNDSTPHTSNVSMTTTITTILTPERNPAKRLQHPPYLVQEDPMKENTSQAGLQTTLGALLHLLCRLEAACRMLANGTKSLKDAEAIEQVYLELLGLSVSNLKEISNFFELTCADPPFSSMARTVSEDPDVDCIVHRPDNNPTRNAFSSRHSEGMPQIPASEAAAVLITHTRNLSHEILRINVVENEANDSPQEVECDLWSPSSEDMNSQGYHPLTDEGNSPIEASTEDNDQANGEPIDDLRRTVGSFDLESVQEEREGVPSWDGDEEDRQEREPFNNPFRANMGRRNNGTRQRPLRKGRFWRPRLLSPRQRWPSAE